MKKRLFLVLSSRNALFERKAFGPLASCYPKYDIVELFTYLKQNLLPMHLSMPIRRSCQFFSRSYFVKHFFPRFDSYGNIAHSNKCKCKRTQHNCPSSVSYFFRIHKASSSRCVCMCNIYISYSFCCN